MDVIEKDVYAIKLRVANDYLKQFETTWNDLPDVNSLHDADNEEEIIELCNKRLKEF